jgi:hypothetical protein
LPRKFLADDDELHEQNTVCANISLPEEKKKIHQHKKGESFTTECKNV